MTIKDNQLLLSLQGSTLLQPYDQKASMAINNELVNCQFWSLNDYYWMHYALALANQGAEHGEVPVGAVLVHNDKAIGKGFNEPIGRHDATAHAEIVAIRDACQHLNNYRLPVNTTLYVTLEPCTMCVGALIHARLSRLVFAADEPRAGMVGSRMDLTNQDFYNHNIAVQKSLCREHSAQLLRSFFRQRRKLAKYNKINENKQASDS